MVTCLASVDGRRRDRGVTRVPSRTRSVREAIAPSSTHGSCTSGSTSSRQRTWSQRNTASQPAASASTPIRTTAAASVNGGMLSACLIPAP